MTCYWGVDWLIEEIKDYDSSLPKVEDARKRLAGLKGS
jgi:hypothetical protein